MIGLAASLAALGLIVFLVTLILGATERYIAAVFALWFAWVLWFGAIVTTFVAAATFVASLIH